MWVLCFLRTHYYWSDPINQILLKMRELSNRQLDFKLFATKIFKVKQSVLIIKFIRFSTLSNYIKVSHTILNWLSLVFRIFKSHLIRLNACNFRNMTLSIICQKFGKVILGPLSKFVNYWYFTFMKAILVVRACYWNVWIFVICELCFFILDQTRLTIRYINKWLLL